MEGDADTTHVYFADTDGRLLGGYDGSVSLNGPRPLGTVVFDEEYTEIVIVDRRPDDDVTQLDINTIIMTILYIISLKMQQNQPQQPVQPSEIAAATSVKPIIAPANDTDLFAQHSSDLITNGPTDAAISKPQFAREDVMIHLPQMNYDMYGEAYVQREFYRHIPNIVVVPV